MSEKEEAMSARDENWTDDEMVEIGFILGVLSQGETSSGTDSSCAFCETYGDAPHRQMIDHDHECIVITARRLIARPR